MTLWGFHFARDTPIYVKAAGASFDDVVKTTVLLRNAEDFRKMKEVYRRYFNKGFPARTTIVGTDFLDSACLVQIDVWPTSLRLSRIDSGKCLNVFSGSSKHDELYAS